MAYGKLAAPYRSAPQIIAPEPWLERAGWKSESIAESDALVAVHAAWGDLAIGTAHIVGDGDFDPWSSLCGLHTHDAAVRVRDGKPSFVFADDLRGKVEGPDGVLTLETLISEGIVQGGGERGCHEIAMEPGLLYRTRRGEITVTAEIVARPARLPPPRRARPILAMLGLVLTALALGSSALAAADVDVELIEDQDRDEVHAELMALIARASELALAADTQREASTPDRYPGGIIVLGRLVPLYGYRRCGLCESTVMQGGSSECYDDWHLCESDAVYPERNADYSPGPCSPDTSEWINPFGGHWCRGARLIGRGERHHVSVHTSQLTWTGAIPSREVGRVVRRNLAQVQSCFDNGIRLRPDLSGYVDVRFVIGGDGDVLGAGIAGSRLSAPRVASCVANAVRRWTFSPPRGEGITVATYTFGLWAPESSVSTRTNSNVRATL